LLRPNWHVLGVVVCCLFSSCSGNSASHYLEKGNAYAEAGKHEDASINYRKAIQKEPQLAEAHYRHGLAEWKLGRLPEAEDALRQAVALSPDHIAAHARLADLYIAAYVSKPGSRPNILAQLQSISKRLLDRDPNSYDGLRIRGYLAMAERKPKEAIELFRRAGASAPLEPDTVLALAQSLVQAGELAEGEKLSLDLLEKEKGFAPGYDSLYVQYVAAKRLTDAERILRLKIANFPEVAEYVIQLATFQDRYKRPATEVERTLRILTSDQQRFPRGPLLVADFYESRGRADKAISALEEAIRGSGDEKNRYRKRLAAVHLMHGDRDAARAAIVEVTQDNPGDSEALAMQAVLRLDSRRPEDINAAVSELSELIKESPGNAQFHLFLGHALRTRGDLDGARSEYVEAAQKRPEWTPPRLALVELALARRQYKEALRYVEEIASYEPLHPRLRLLQSVAMVGAGFVQNAKGELEKLAQEFPGKPEPLLELGFIEVSEKRFQEAERRFRKLHQAGQKDLRALIGLVEVLLAQQRSNEAIQFLEKEVPRSQNPAGVRRLLALTERRRGRTDSAIRHYRQLATENPGSWDVLFSLGDLYLQKNDYEQALEFLEKAQALAPRDPRSPLWLGFTMERLGRMEEATKHYESALRLDPANPLALNNLANLLSETGSLDEALKLANQALEKVPEHPEFLDTLGVIYLKKKLPDSALQIFQNLAKKHPSVSRFRYRLALAHMEKGDKRQARAELETALTGEASEELVKQIKNLLEKIG
jgi:tetratricopeptide (TPR) repeat protein